MTPVPPTPAPVTPGRAPRLAEWIAADAPHRRDLGDLFRSLCDQLAGLGLPLTRVSLLLELLHPVISGDMLEWRAADDRVRATVATHAGADMEAYETSPLAVVDRTGSWMRRRLDDGPPGFPLLDRLAAEGATDYLIVPFPFVDRRRSAAISFATAEPGGFSDADVADLIGIVGLVGATFEVRVLRLAALDLLDTYVGPRAGSQVLEGAIRRGDGGTLDAVIWYSDLRDFTALVESLPTEQVLGLLNDYFDIVTNAATAHGAEVVQHVGDAILSFFEIGAQSRDAVCRAALEGAIAAMAAAADHNAAAPERPPIRFGIGLDVGRVIHGNVGSVRRLSFNLLGPPVNRAARIETLTKSLGRPLLMSGDFARAVDRPLECLGPHAIKGVVEPVEVFAQAAPNRGGPQ